MPMSSKALTIGTSVRVEKYISAPKTDATMFDIRLLPPTATSTHCCGMTALINPAAKTPIKRTGKIIFINFQVSTSQSMTSSLVYQNASTRAIELKSVMIMAILDHKGMSEVPKRSIATSTPKKASKWIKGLPSSPANIFSSFSLFSSSFRKIRAINNPITIEKVMAPTALASPSSHPIFLAVSTIASMFMAGPAKRNVTAGPKPAPFL